MVQKVFQNPISIFSVNLIFTNGILVTKMAEETINLNTIDLKIKLR